MPASRPTPASSTIALPVLNRSSIAEQLRSLIDGEVRFGRHDRMLYATDASIYQVEPIGVVVPRSIDDVQKAVRFCAEHRLAVLPRGGGTSLAGQAVNQAVILDFSAYCNGILDIDPLRRTATVEAGVILSQLNQTLQPHGLLFGPDVATATHANIGGMIGNNSAGARSVLYGRTVENLLVLDVCLADGRMVHLAEGESERDAAVGELTRRVADVVLPLADQIDARFPRTLRRSGGYNLDLILAQLRASSPGTFDKVNLAHLLCGSEGTLGVTLRATLSLVDAPQCKALAIVACNDVDAALAQVAPILGTCPAAVELIDDVVLNLAEKNNECRGYLNLLPHRDPRGAVLYVEYFAESDDKLDQRRVELARLCGNERMCWYSDAASMTQAWKLRASGEPLLHGVPGDRKPLTFVEDAAVDPEKLCQFIREFRRIVESHGTTAAFYAHASVGCLHVRPMISLRDENDRAAVTAIAEAVTDLARDMGGTNSGEHGDGRLRSHLNVRFFGREIVNGFRAIKAIFDPDNRLNPGNIVEPTPMLAHLRVQPDQTPVEIPAVRTYFRYDHEGGFGPAVEMCNGAGVCRKRSGGTMCPSYRATLDERHATRGRGNALRLAISGQLSDDATAPKWNDAQTLRTLDLCLSCKACKSECPSNVDIARLKAEYLAQSYDAGKQMSLATLAFGNVHLVNRIGSALHRVANGAGRLSRILADQLLGIDPRRSLPRFERSLHRWFSARSKLPRTDGPTVILFGDCFTAYNEPHIGQAAVRVLESLGYRVVLPQAGCCGRSLISVGLLAKAQQVARRTAEAILKQVQQHDAVAIVGCEPSCVSAIVDDWNELKLDIDRASLQQVIARTMGIEDFIERNWHQHPAVLTGQQLFAVDEDASPVLLHGHCHQKALWGTEATMSLLERTRGGDAAQLIEAGCCGMAGSFGYTKDHYDLSMRIGELELMPAIRAQQDAVIAAPGTSCRHQIKDATGRAAVHPIELVDRSIAVTSTAQSMQH